MRKIKVSPKNEKFLETTGIKGIQNGLSAEDLLKRPQIEISMLKKFDEQFQNFPDEVLEQLEIEIKYDGYIKRQIDQVERFKKAENIAIPEDLNYDAISGLTAEVREKLMKVRPLTLGQASRIRGMTPAAMAILSVAVRRAKGEK